MTVETLKAAGVVVERYEHHPEQRGHISEPVPIRVWLKRENNSFNCMVYQKHDDPRWGYVLQDDDYLRLIVDRYKMNVAEYYDIAGHLPNYRGKFDQLPLELRKSTTKQCESFRGMLEVFLQ